MDSSLLKTVIAAAALTELSADVHPTPRQSLITAPKTKSKAVVKRRKANKAARKQRKR